MDGWMDEEEREKEIKRRKEEISLNYYSPRSAACAVCVYIKPL